MSFVAKYPGRCQSSDCHYGDNQISAGDWVDYVFEHELMHDICAAKAADPDADQHDDSRPCPHCWKYHRGECA